MYSSAARVPVISVGNIAMGGRGKTPVVAHIARLLVAAGERPAILSRGYGRRSTEPGVVVVSDGEHITADLDRSGDEPLMLARMVQGARVLVCDVRAMAAAFAERQLGATVHLMDDGFQHRSLERDVDLVIVTPEDLRGRRLPFGRLRSPVSSLASADAVIIDPGPNASVGVGFDGTPRKLPRYFSLVRTLGSPEPLEPERPWPAGRWPVVVLAGIAEPARFKAAAQRAGWHVSASLLFRDHHRYTRRDIERVAALLREHGAGAVLTTAKDAIRLLPWRPLPVPVAVLPLDVSVEPADDFRSWLLGRVREARS